MSVDEFNQDNEELEQRRLRGIYLLPNFFTTAGLFAGFYAIVAAMKGLFAVAAVATFIAMLADSLDGRVARLTNTQSTFGAEYDSLSDMVAFGIAPALVAYSWALHALGKIGWLAAFFYAAATALRLARFNIQASLPNADKRYFNGLPCTSAAGFITGMIWVESLYHLHHAWIVWSVCVSTVLAGILMVSNIHYRSFKDIDMKGSVPFMMILIILLLFMGIALDPPEVLFGIFAIYTFSGLLFFLIHCVKKLRYRNMKKKTSIP